MQLRESLGGFLYERLAHGVWINTVAVKKELNYERIAVADTPRVQTGQLKRPTIVFRAVPILCPHALVLFSVCRWSQGLFHPFVIAPARYPSAPRSSYCGALVQPLEKLISR